MRKITSQAVDAFMSAKSFNKANTSVEVLPDKTILRLHGNAIAHRYNDRKKTLKITNAGWFSQTTKERLNALPGVSIFQSNWDWYLNGKKWDGSLIEVK